MNTTKIALEASLKELLKKKPFDKITIADLTEDCGSAVWHFTIISRISMIWWSGHVWKTAKKPFGIRKLTIPGKKAFAQIFEAVLENKPFIMNVYHSVRREKIESFLYKLTYQLIADVVEEKMLQRSSFIADFHKYGFVGLMLDWIKQGMKEDYHEIVERMSVMLHGNINEFNSEF